MIGAYVADDEDHGRDRTVREFIAEFRGFARSDIQKTVLDAVGASRVSLREFFTKPKQVEKLLAMMQEVTSPVAAKDLGVLGKAHFMARFEEVAVSPRTFQYRRLTRDIDGVPYVIEAAFGYCPDATQTRVQVVGVNWSSSLINPYRELGDDAGLDFLLADQRAGEEEPIVLALHVASPRIAYTDKAKSALLLPDEVALDFSSSSAWRHQAMGQGAQSRRA